MKKKITHIDESGFVRMVDVTNKENSLRVAIAQGLVNMSDKIFNLIKSNENDKGNVLETARIAGIIAAKKTSSIIPMCHPIRITHVQIDFFPDQEKNSIRVEAKVKNIASTGVEMEALTAVSISCLTIYDMCKSYDKSMIISNIHLVKKSGGKSGNFEF